MAAEERTINVDGMDCSGCENRLRTSLTRVEGVIKADPDHKAGRVVVRLDIDRISEEEVKERILAAGFDV